MSQEESNESGAGEARAARRKGGNSTHMRVEASAKELPDHFQVEGEGQFLRLRQDGSLGRFIGRGKGGEVG